MKRIISIFLAALVCSSSIGLALNQHHCGEYIMAQTLALGAEELYCGMEAEEEERCANDVFSNEHIQEMPCCKNIFHLFQLDDELKNQRFIALNLATSQAITTEVFSFHFLQYTEASLVHSFDYAVPPPPKRKLHIYFQTFLI